MSDLVSAREPYLRASTYYGHAYVLTYGASEPDRIGDVWEQSRAMGDRFAALLQPTVQAVTILYEGTTLPGYVLRVDDSGARRPWLIMNNGSDGTTGDMWMEGAATGPVVVTTCSCSMARARAKRCGGSISTSGRTGKRS